MNFTENATREKIESIAGEGLRQKNRMRVFALTFIAAALASVFIFAASFAAGAFTEIISNTPDIDNLDEISPSSTKSIMYDADGNVMQELVQSGSNRISVNYDQMPENLVNAFVSIEDARFFEHNGVDVKGVFRALFVGITSGTLSEGASTLTQQLIKNNVFNGGLESNFGDRIERKLQEQALALKVEKNLSKETIVQYYLNTINLGNNCLGVQVAANRYFGKDVSELDLAECTVLAAITQNPSKYNPLTHPDKNQERRLKVLDSMLELGMITEDAYNEASGEDVYTRISDYSANYSSTSGQVFSYFTDAVFEDVIEALQERLDYTDTQAYNALYSGGLRIYTTMDPDMQSILEEECNDPANYVVENEDGTVTDYAEYELTYRLTLKTSGGDLYYYTEEDLKNYYMDVMNDKSFTISFATEDELNAAVDTYRSYLVKKIGGEVVSETVTSSIQPQISCILMDQTNGHVLAIVGGRGDKNELGSLVLNRATMSERQPGSTFKILTAYAAALDVSGATLATTYYDAEYLVEGKPVSNWWGSQYLGYANIRYAIMASMNIIAIKCMEDTVSEDTAYNYAKSLGISTLVEKDKSPVMTLGGLTYGVTNEELTAAYACIANGGVYNEPVYWTKITKADGTVLLENTPEEKVVLKETTAKLLTSALEEAVSPQYALWPQYSVGATSSQCKVEGMAIAGKSGTTNDANDLWFIGYSPYMTLGIWTGYDSNKSFGESPGYHRVIWQKIMSRISSGLPPASFDYSGLTTAQICSKSGLLARNGICDCTDDPSCHVYEEFFIPGTEPTEYCDRHSVYLVCNQSGKLANEYCPESQVTRKVYLTIDPSDEQLGDTDDTLYTLPAELRDSSCTIHGKGKNTETEKETDKETDKEESSDEKEKESSAAPEEETTAEAEESAPAEESTEAP